MSSTPCPAREPCIYILHIAGIFHPCQTGEAAGIIFGFLPATAAGEAAAGPKKESATPMELHEYYRLRPLRFDLGTSAPGAERQQRHARASEKNGRSAIRDG
jgi:hypothetical protein